MSELCRIDSPQEQLELLAIARETAYRALRGADETSYTPPPIAGRFGGAFVTFRRGETLRGCVGTFEATTSIVATLQEMTRAALEDSRFVSNPVTATELKDLEIEISILSDQELTRDPCSLVPGTHGIIIRRGERSGCFLPKVASDRGWSAEQFLNNCCTMKALLPPNAWREPDTQTFLFTAQVITESRRV